MTSDPPKQSTTGPFEPPEDLPVLTQRDRAYMQLYIRLLDADAAGVAWQLIARDILELDPSVDQEGAKSVFDRFLARARWMTKVGYQHLLKPDP
jgi:hypothetical protein